MGRNGTSLGTVVVTAGAIHRVSPQLRMMRMREVQRLQQRLQRSSVERQLRRQPLVVHEAGGRERMHNDLQTDKEHPSGSYGTSSS